MDYSAVSQAAKRFEQKSKVDDEIKESMQKVITALKEVWMSNVETWPFYSHYCHDSQFAPKGKSVIQTQIETDFFYWKNLYEKDRNAYNREKELVLEIYIRILNDIFLGIGEDIEITDIATPVTWERYTGNWQGSYEGWVPTVKTFGVTLPKKLPGLGNFYMTGQWVFPGGGVPMCMAQGKNLIKMIVKQEKKTRN